MDETGVREILGAEWVRSALGQIEVESVAADLPTLRTENDAADPDLNRLLGLASWLVATESEEAQTAILRVAHYCLASSTAQPAQRAAALVLLERVGNRRTIDLARERGLLHELEVGSMPPQMVLDVARARISLSIPIEDKLLPANPFQRNFWTDVSENDWLSVSAPTSVGKSYIVRQWFAERLTAGGSFTGVYIVPTRALIDEVGRDLRAAVPGDVPVMEFPWDARASTGEREIYVLTQERLHLLLERFSGLVADLVFVDEAQKFGDDSRGVLLQRTLDDLTKRSADTQVIFASPLAENPEILLQSAPPTARTTSRVGHTVTVLQNLLWADQVRGDTTRWTLDLVAHDTVRRLGDFELAARPTLESKRLPYVAVALTGSSGSSVVYANGAADAEKMALQIADLLPAPGASEAAAIGALVELVEATIHRNYALVAALKKGVAFHYGNMPQLVRTEIERLFRTGAIRYLVCTSTLLEGVNLPCRNLFMRGPTRGRGNPLNEADFWNLAGRAGRWGTEFQGNVVCVDASKANQWPRPPRGRVRYPLVRATDDVLDQPDDLLSYIRADTPIGTGQGRPPLESVFSYLSSRVASGLELADVPALANLPREQVSEIESTVRAALERIDVPARLISRHAGISPIAMQRLLDLFRATPDKRALRLALPESDDAVELMAAALNRVGVTMTAEFGNEGRAFMLAILIVHWMRGRPLAVIISERIGYNRRHGREFKLPALIRECMGDVEKYARFEAPKYLACYVDLLQLHFEEEGLTDDLPRLPDVAMLLELGVSRQTELSLMTLGLSRTVAIMLGEYISGDELTAAECVSWLQHADLEGMDLPELVRREAAAALAAAR